MHFSDFTLHSRYAHPAFAASTHDRWVQARNRWAQAERGIQTKKGKDRG